MAVSIEEFMKRLNAMSVHDGVPYGRAHRLFGAEGEHEQAILQYKGYLALSDALKCFFLETTELINVDSRPKIKAPLSEFYGLFIPRMSHSFLSLCGAERIAIRGYPYQGYTLLRNVFDNLVLTSAALQKITDFYTVEGIEPGKAFEPVAAKRLRKSTEYAVRRQMTGDQSGLSSVTVGELSKWDALFDYETHGARLSLTKAMSWMQGHSPLPILPQFEEAAFAMFMNRSSEVGWMFHRLVPLMQPPNVPLPDPWRDKWRVIDESFEQMVHSLTAQLGKVIGAAMVEFVRAKFPFSDKSQFPL